MIASIRPKSFNQRLQIFHLVNDAIDVNNVSLISFQKLSNRHCVRSLALEPRTEKETTKPIVQVAIEQETHPQEATKLFESPCSNLLYEHLGELIEDSASNEQTDSSLMIAESSGPTRRTSDRLRKELHYGEHLERVPISSISSISS